MAQALSHLNGWRAVDAVLRLGSVTAAAGALGVTTAAVGAQIRGLEERLGHPLFRRGAGGLEPLPDTLAEAGRLAAAFSELAGVQGRLGAQEVRDRVAITMTQIFAENWFPRHMGDLFARHRPLDLRFDTTWDVVNLAVADIDFAVRHAAAVAPGHASVDLFPGGVIPVCTPDFAERYNLTPATRDLRDVPLIHFSAPSRDPVFREWADWAEAAGFDLPDHFTESGFATSSSGLTLARSGLGLYLGGFVEALHAVVEGALICPFGKDVAQCGTYLHRLVWHEGRRMGPRQRAVRDWIADRAAEDRIKMRAAFGVGLTA